jgi:hypothetical protein
MLVVPWPYWTVGPSYVLSCHFEDFHNNMKAAPTASSAATMPVNPRSPALMGLAAVLPAAPDEVAALPLSVADADP